jgi:hypothetical protein
MPLEDTENAATLVDESTAKLFVCGILQMNNIEHLSAFASALINYCPKFAYRFHTTKKRTVRLLIEFLITQPLREFLAMPTFNEERPMVSPVNMTQVQHSTGLVYVEPLIVKKPAPDFLTSALTLEHLNEVDPTAHTRVTLEV